MTPNSSSPPDIGKHAVAPVIPKQQLTKRKVKVFGVCDQCGATYPELYSCCYSCSVPLRRVEFETNELAEPIQIGQSTFTINIPQEEKTTEHILKVIREYDPRRQEQEGANFKATVGHCDHLIHVSLERHGWFLINGEKQLRFKARGNKQCALRAACIKYDIDFWEGELEQCAQDMADQLYHRAMKRREPLKLKAIV